MKKSVYIETTIPSYYFEEREELKYQKDATQKWWNTQKQYYVIYTSEITIAELEFGNYPNKTNIIRLVENVPRLSTPVEIKDIVEIYLKNYLMPRKDIRDAFHLAIASYYKIDYLLTWNCEHLANINKEEHVKIVNEKIGMSTPRIITPLQLFREESDV